MGVSGFGFEFDGTLIMNINAKTLSSTETNVFHGLESKRSKDN